MEKIKKVSLWVRYGNTICFVVWLLLFCAWIVCASINAKIWITNGLLMVLLTWTIWCFIKFMQWVNKMEDIESEKREKYLDKLKEKYPELVNLVSDVLDEELKKCSEGLPDILDIDRDLDYLIAFEKRIKWVRERKNIGRPDSFIIASCMVYALMEKPKIVSKESNIIWECEGLKKTMNLNIAIACAMRIIAEPVTYFRDFIGEWCSDKHSKVKIVIPKGIIREVNLEEQIMQALYDDELSHNRTSIIQLANIFHLIYMYSLISEKNPNKLEKIM